MPTVDDDTTDAVTFSSRSEMAGDFITEQKLLEILNQLSNGGSAIQICITQALTDKTLYSDFISDRKSRIGRVRRVPLHRSILASMTQLYHHEYANSEHSTLPVISFVPSLMADSTWDASMPFDTHLHTMLDEMMMWCVTARLPEDLVRFLLSLLPDLNFKVVR